MSVINELSSPAMYLICGSIVAFVALVCVVFAVRAWRAGKAIGMDPAVLKRVVTASASFSVLRRERAGKSGEFAGKSVEKAGKTVQ